MYKCTWCSLLGLAEKRIKFLSSFQSNGIYHNTFSILKVINHVLACVVLCCVLFNVRLFETLSGKRFSTHFFVACVLTTRITMTMCSFWKWLNLRFFHSNKLNILLSKVVLFKRQCSNGNKRCNKQISESC